MRLRTLILLVLAAALLALGSAFDVYTVTVDTCLRCRATRVRRQLGGIPLDTVSPAKDAPALAGLEPGYSHHWRWCGSANSYSLIGSSTGCGRAHPVSLLPVEVQGEYARTATAQEYDASLSVLDGSDQRAAEAESQRLMQRHMDRSFKARAKDE